MHVSGASFIKWKGRYTTPEAIKAIFTQIVLFSGAVFTANFVTTTMYITKFHLNLSQKSAAFI